MPHSDVFGMFLDRSFKYFYRLQIISLIHKHGRKFNPFISRILIILLKNIISFSLCIFLTELLLLVRIHSFRFLPLLHKVQILKNLSLFSLFECLIENIFLCCTNFIHNYLITFNLNFLRLQVF